MIRLVAIIYVRFPMSLRNVENPLFAYGIDISHETARLWWNRFMPLFAADICRQRVSRMHGFHHWRWHLGIAEKQEVGRWAGNWWMTDTCRSNDGKAQCCGSHK